MELRDQIKKMDQEQLRNLVIEALSLMDNPFLREVIGAQILDASEAGNKLTITRARLSQLNKNQLPKLKRGVYLKRDVEERAMRMMEQRERSEIRSWP